MHNIRGVSVSRIIGVDHAHAGELVARHLVETHGSRRAAFVGGFTEADVSHGDRETVEQRFAGVGSVVGDVVHIPTDLTPTGAYAAVGAFLQASPDIPDALVAGTYGQTAATIRAIVDAGLSIPDDVRVVGFDGTISDYGQFDVTTVQQPVDAMTREALDELLGAPDAVPVPLEPSLRIGNSCGCA
jgi:LacI family transcriptional regulator